MEIVSLIIGILLLIVLSYKGVATYLSALIASVVILLLNGLNIWEGMSQTFASGFVSFVSSYIFVLTIGAMFGRLMSASGAAKAFALKLLAVFGEKRIVWVIIISAIVMAFCGINIYIIFYAIYPIAVVIGQRQNVNKGVLASAIFCMAFTTCFPGTISLNNIIGSTVLGSKLTAGWQVGIPGCLVVLAICLVYTFYTEKKCKEKGLGFEAGPKDHLYLNSDLDDADLPHWAPSILPLLVVAVLAIVLSNFLDATMAVVIALIVASLLIIVLHFKRLKGQLSTAMGEGLMDGFGPLLTISALVGFGAVVRTTPGFANIVNLALGLDVHPYMGTFIGTNLLVGVTGSMSGGLNIFMETLAPSYVSMGVNPDIIHRIAAMSACGLDSLPHSAGIIGQLAVMQLSLKKGYKHAFFTTVVATIAGAFVTTILAMIFY